MRVQTLLSKLGIEVDTMTVGSLFNLLDLDGDGEINETEFAIGLSQVHGSARSIDVAKLSFDLIKVQRQLHNISRQIKGQSQQLQKSVTQDLNKQSLRARK